MADEQNPSGDYYHAPVPVWPRDEAVVDGASVRFEWEPVEGATHYHLQVAREASFETVVLEREVDGATSVTVTDGFAADQEVYFWRVIVRGEDGVARGYDSIESFISSTAEAAALEMGRPDERLGPPTELLKGAAATAVAEVTQDAPHFEREIEMGVAHEGIPAGQILGFALAIVLAIVLIVVSLIQYTQITAQTVRYQAVGVSGYPQLREVQAEAVRQLTQYDVVDEAQGVYRIPIERAMELMANEAYRDGGGTYSTELPVSSRDTMDAQ